MPISVKELKEIPDCSIVKFLEKNSQNGYYIKELAAIFHLDRYSIWRDTRKPIEKGVIKVKKIGRKRYLYYNDGE